MYQRKKSCKFKIRSRSKNIEYRRKQKLNYVNRYINKGRNLAWAQRPFTEMRLGPYLDSFSGGGEKGDEGIYELNKGRACSDGNDDMMFKDI